MGIDPPKARPADVGKARAEAVAKEAKKSEDDVAVGTGVGHDPRRRELGLLLQHDREQDQAVAQRAGCDDAIETRKLVG